MPTATRLRRDVALLVGEAESDLAGMWRHIETPQQAEAALRDVLPALITTYGSAAATVAADWYDDVRDRAGVRGSFRAIPAEIPEPGAQALVGWALAEASDLPGFQTLILGGAQRRITNFSRLTVTGSSIADPRAVGWQRVGGGSSCDFCSMLLGRGAVYSESTADFEAHDHDQCGAEPVWR